MGVADAMGPLSSQVSKDPMVAALVPFFVFIAFALFSVPGGVLAARIGKKGLLLLGLVLCCAATAVPTFADPSFAALLACIFLLGLGSTFLQVAGNPIMRDVSATCGVDPRATSEGAYSRNLAVAQGIKGIGSASSSYLATTAASIAILSAMGWRGAFPVFFALTTMTLAAVAALRVNETKTEAAGEAPPTIAKCLALLGKPSIALVVLGIFLYVGAEVCMATFLGPALLSIGLEESGAALFGPSLFFGAITLGRLAVGGIKLGARALFRVSAMLGIIGLLALAAGLFANHRGLAVSAVVVCALGFANVWPMLFAITIEERPERASELSGLMCTAVCGGAVAPLAMGALGGGAPLAFLVPVACFAYLALLSSKRAGNGG
jgi:fucose permease